MRSLMIAAPVLLAACASTPAQSVVNGDPPGRTCSAVATDQFIGRPGTSETGAAIKKATNAAVLRWAPPGTMLSMIFEADRVTVWLGPDGKVTKVSCG